MIEMLGYLGSALVVASMLMSSVVKLRVINTIGSGMFAVYALIIHSYPTALMNICLVAINVCNLVRLSRKDQSYDLVDGAGEEGLLGYLLDYYRADIQTYFPDFSRDRVGDRAFIVCCNGNPAGLLLGIDGGQGPCRCCWTTPHPPTATAPSEGICTTDCPPEGCVLWSSQGGPPRPTGLI